MPNPVVVNASPIIVLAKTGFLDLLRLVGDPIFVPRAVIQEIQQTGPNDPAVLALAQAPWLQVVDPGPIPAAVQSTWAASHPGTEAVIDDFAARQRAKALGIPYRGCIGIVITARRLGVIPLARPVLEQLRLVGLRISDRIVNQALALVGE